MVTIREWLKEKRESSKRKAAELFKNTKDKTTETYNKVLDTEVEDIKNKTKKFKQKARETIDKVDDAAYEGSQQLKSEIPAFISFFVWLVLPYIFISVYRYSFDGMEDSPVNILGVFMISIGALLTLTTVFARPKNKLKGFARTTAVFFSLLTFPLASEYFDYRKYLDHKSFCDTYLKWKNPPMAVLDEQSCTKLQSNKMSYVEFLGNWKNIR